VICPLSRRSWNGTTSSALGFEKARSSQGERIFFAILVLNAGSGSFEPGFRRSSEGFSLEALDGHDRLRSEFARSRRGEDHPSSADEPNNAMAELDPIDLFAVVDS
jgi:hypothetical protein